MSKKIINDLIKFLKDDRPELRSTACSTVAQLTGTEDGFALILCEENLLSVLVKCIQDYNEDVVKNALKVLINVSSEEAGTKVLMNLTDVDVIKLFIDHVSDPQYAQADDICVILSNMTHSSIICEEILNRIHQIPSTFDDLINIICQIGYNKKGATLDILVRVLSNLTQTRKGRELILDRDKRHFERLLSLIDYPDSKQRRAAIISTIHNLCFDKNHHEWMLSDDIDLATRLALPLAGPDVFTSEENDSLPLDLQYLPENKLREECPELRKLILESFLQLCVTRPSREKLRSLNIYLILREHHKWEREERCIILNEDVVNFLIRTEDEIGLNDVSSVEIPEDIAKKFDNNDK